MKKLSLWIIFLNNKNADQFRKATRNSNSASKNSGTCSSNRFHIDIGTQHQKWVVHKRIYITSRFWNHQYSLNWELMIDNDKRNQYLACPIRLCTRRFRSIAQQTYSIPKCLTSHGVTQCLIDHWFWITLQIEALIESN